MYLEVPLVYQAWPLMCQDMCLDRQGLLSTWTGSNLTVSVCVCVLLVMEVMNNKVRAVVLLAITVRLTVTGTFSVHALEHTEVNDAVEVNKKNVWANLRTEVGFRVKVAHRFSSVQHLLFKLRLVQR